MGILADSAIVGAATFLVGSVLMGLSIKQEGKDVKWWPYVGTFIAGSLGFYLVATPPTMSSILFDFPNTT